MNSSSYTILSGYRYGYGYGYDINTNTKIWLN